MLLPNPIIENWFTRKLMRTTNAECLTNLIENVDVWSKKKKMLPNFEQNKHSTDLHHVPVLFIRT